MSETIRKPHKKKKFRLLFNNLAASIENFVITKVLGAHAAVKEVNTIPSSVPQGISGGLLFASEGLKTILQTWKLFRAPNKNIKQISEFICRWIVMLLVVAAGLSWFAGAYPAVAGLFFAAILMELSYHLTLTTISLVRSFGNPGYYKKLYRRQFWQYLSNSFQTTILLVSVLAIFLLPLVFHLSISALIWAAPIMVLSMTIGIPFYQLGEKNKKLNWALLSLGSVLGIVGTLLFLGVFTLNIFIPTPLIILGCLSIGGGALTAFLTNLIAPYLKASFSSWKMTIGVAATAFLIIASITLPILGFFVWPALAPLMPLFIAIGMTVGGMSLWTLTQAYLRKLERNSESLLPNEKPKETVNSFEMIINAKKMYELNSSQKLDQANFKKLNIISILDKVIGEDTKIFDKVLRIRDESLNIDENNSSYHFYQHYNEVSQMKCSEQEKIQIISDRMFAHMLYLEYKILNQPKHKSLHQKKLDLMVTCWNYLFEDDVSNITLTTESSANSTIKHSKTKNDKEKKLPPCLFAYESEFGFIVVPKLEEGQDSTTQPILITHSSKVFQEHISQAKILSGDGAFQSSKHDKSYTELLLLDLFHIVNQLTLTNDQKEQAHLFCEKTNGLQGAPIKLPGAKSEKAAKNVSPEKAESSSKISPFRKAFTPFGEDVSAI